MRELIEKKMKTAKVFRICLLVVFGLWMCFILLLGSVDTEVIYIPFFLLTNVMWISAVVYYAKYHPVMSSMKWLKQRGLENIADDIDLDAPTLPRSKIYCGQNALLCKKPYAIIPYCEIAWVYVHETRSYGITVDRTIIVYAKDGKKFQLKSNVDEFQWLLQKYVIANSPDIIIGYGTEQKQKYAQVKRNNRIG